MQRKTLHTDLESHTHLAMLKLAYFFNSIFQYVVQNQPKMIFSVNFRNIPLDVETVYVVNEFHNYAEHSLQQEI